MEQDSKGKSGWSEDRPTPPSLRLDRSQLHPPTLIQRMQRRPWVLALLVLVGIVAVVLSGLALPRVLRPGGGWRGWRALIAPRQPSVDHAPAPPPSLKEVGAQYPDLSHLLNDAALGSVYKEFIIAYERGGIDAARALAVKRGLLNDREEIRITLVVDQAENVPLIVDEMEAAGITVEGSYRERINVGVPMPLIQRLSAQEGIQGLFEQLTQMRHIIRLELPLPNRPDSTTRVDGEGIAIIGAPGWHANGYEGQGIRIGVLDLGFDDYRDLLGAELPSDVLAESFVYGRGPDEIGEIHGTACAEIVHEIAPGAELVLACYDGSLVSEGQAVDWLMAQDVNIISHSAGSVMGPMDGTGANADLADQAAARGILWVNSSGNEAESHYRGQFTDTDGDDLHEFPGGDELIALWPYAHDVVIVLNWDDWEKTSEDYDLYVYDAKGDLVASAEDAQDGSPGQVAAERLELYNASQDVYYVAIEAYRTSRRGMLDLYTPGADVEFPVAERSLGTPADARGALTVGATEYRDDTVAPYSSQGPTTDGRLKPELSAPTGVSGVSYGPDGFDGTSASAPHVAGAAALVWSAFPSYTLDEVRANLESNALDLGPPGPDNGYGHGRVHLSDPPQEAAEPTVLIPTELPPATVVSVETAVASIAAPLATASPPLPTPPIGAPTVAPTQLPTAAPAESEASTMVGSSRIALLAGLSLMGLCGGSVAVGGLTLLLVARRQARQRPAQALAPLQPPRPATRRGGARTLSGPGIPPVTLESGASNLGRSGDNDIVLDHPTVSRRHARVTCDGETCTVEDLGSANGTYVNDGRVTIATLVPGDRLRLGDVELVYAHENDHRRDAWLEIDGEVHPIGRTPITIGRAADQDVYLPDELVSRRHARIDEEDDRFVIADLGSTNGTFVNGRRIQRQSLRAGDEIRIGRISLQFESAV